MTRTIDLTGQVFGRWTVIGQADTRKYRQTHWHCRCACKTLRVVSGANLRRGYSRSCGCLKQELAVKQHTTHGMSKLPEYINWRHIIQRCTNPNCSKWPYYGGRGITVCETWIHSFSCFYADMGPRPSARHSIDRKDNNKGYSRDNCKWSTQAEQCRNKRNNVWIVYRGERIVLAELAELLNVDRTTLGYRIKRGWPESRWSEPVQTKFDHRPKTTST